jgi:hypothetical protein
MILLCSNCKYFEITNKHVSCSMGYWKNILLKDAVLYSPIDFDCLSYEEGESNESVKKLDKSS